MNKKVIKKILFVTLFWACIAAAVLLFLPDTCPVRLGIMRIVQPGAQQEEKSSVTEPTVEQSVSPNVFTKKVVVGEWNTYHGGNALQGVVAGTIPDELVVLWSVLAGAAVRQPPVVHNGIVVAVNAQSEVFALTSDGKELWRRTLKAPDPAVEEGREVYIEAPITAFGDKVVLGSDMGDVFALNINTGEAYWWTNIEGAVRGAPNYSDDGSKIFVINQDMGALVCLDANSGKTLWQSTAPDRSDASPAVANDVAVYGSCASALHVIDLVSGNHVQDIAIKEGGGQIAGGVALLDGFAYAGVRDGRVVCADIKAGKFKWMTTVSDLEVFCTPAVNSEWVVVTDYDGRIHGLDRETGEIKWQQELTDTPSSPVIVDDKIVVSDEGVLYLLRLDNGAHVWQKQIADAVTDPAVIHDMVLLGTEDGTVTALGTGN